MKRLDNVQVWCLNGDAFFFLERYLAKQNPLLQTDRPHQLFADAPPKPPG